MVENFQKANKRMYCLHLFHEPPPHATIPSLQEDSPSGWSQHPIENEFLEMLGAPFHPRPTQPRAGIGGHLQDAS